MEGVSVVANNCEYIMKVVGSETSLQKWVEKMNDYEEKNHFFRIFSCEVYEKGVEDNGMYYYKICGDCAWSLESCCRASGYSGGVDLFEVNTRDLQLIMEAYSKEVGMEFQEHYIYKYGKCLADECEKYCEYWWDTYEYPTFEEFKHGYNLPEELTEDDLDDDREAYCEGGFGEWTFEI